MAPSIRYKTFPWPGQRRPCDVRLERRVRELVEGQGWGRQGLPGRFGQRLVRAGDGHAATLTVSCSPYGDWVRLALRGGPWVPPGYRVRMRQGAPGDRPEPDPPDVVTPLGEAFLVDPVADFADASGPLGDALARSRATGVDHDEIAWRAIGVPIAPAGEAPRLVADYVDACLRDAEAWAAATRLFLRSRRYR